VSDSWAKLRNYQPQNKKTPQNTGETHPPPPRGGFPKLQEVINAFAKSSKADLRAELKKEMKAGKKEDIHMDSMNKIKGTIDSPKC